MYRQGVAFAIPLDQRILAQLFNSCIQLKRVFGYSLKRWTKFICPLRDNLFWKIVGSQKGTQAQQVGSRRVGLPPSGVRRIASPSRPPKTPWKFRCPSMGAEGWIFALRPLNLS